MREWPVVGTSGASGYSTVCASVWLEAEQGGALRSVCYDDTFASHLQPRSDAIMPLLYDGGVACGCTRRRRRRDAAGGRSEPHLLGQSRVISERQLRYCRHGGAGERYFTEDDKLGDCTQKFLL